MSMQTNDSIASVNDGENDMINLYLLLYGLSNTEFKTSLTNV